MTIKTKITWFIAGAGFITSLFFSVMVCVELLEQPFRLLDTILQEDAHRISQLVTERREELRLKSFKEDSHEIYAHWLKIYGQNDQKIFYQSDLSKRIHIPLIPFGEKSTVWAVVSGKEGKFEGNGAEQMPFRVRSFLTRFDGRHLVVQIARPMEKLQEEIREVLIGLPTGLVLSAILLVIISRFMAGKILKPINNMKDLARHISERNLNQRIPTRKEQDEFNELADTINGMLDRLQFSFARQQELLFDTSHELKTPLTTLRLALDEIVVNEEENISPATLKSFSRMKYQVFRIDRLVKDLLNLSSLEAANVITEKSFDLLELLKSLLADYQILADAQEISIEMPVKDPLMILGDSDKLYRVFSNIIDNALKYNNEGGWVKIDISQSADAVMVAVTNSGPGVAQEDLARVFDQFYHVEKSRSTRNGGSGLGLTMVKRIVELHRGTVHFESKQGAWSRAAVRRLKGMNL